MPAAERTMILLKPEAFRRLLVDRIIDTFVNAGFVVKAARTVVKPQRSLVEEHYCPEEFAALHKLEIRKRVVSYCCSGTVMAVLLERTDAIARAEAMRDIIHGPRNAEEAGRQIRLWFKM